MKAEMRFMYSVVWNEQRWKMDMDAGELKDHFSIILENKYEDTKHDFD
jgi:hypothetical protein